jgi:hypothetical protein
MGPIEPSRARVIDVTGLPDEAIEAVQAIIEVLRRQAVALPPRASASEWSTQFDAWMGAVALRANRYPAGFIVDDSRETIYEGPDE